ncbi:MAG: ABC transporter ATP-binding protein [Lachnospiraceae bacterium]
MKEKILLEIKNLTFRYEDGTKALSQVNLNIKEGEKIAILGANGSGKSTLFLCLVGLLKPQEGEILFQGAPVDYSRKGLRDLRKCIGIVFQEPDNQLFSASVYQEISFGPMNLGWEEEKVKLEVDRVIQELEITSFQDKPTHFLSGGEKKQVSIADIIAMNPEVILMDEPTSALDPKHSEMVNQTIEQLCKAGITLLISTHDGDYAMEWADRIVLFHEGCVERIGPPELIFQDIELLERTHQTKPKVLQLYHTLTEIGLLEEQVVIPKSIKELQQCLEKLG